MNHTTGPARIARISAPQLLRFALPALLLALFAVEKASLNPSSRYERQADGSYYFQIADHVAKGKGLRTSVSLYGQGLRNMPAPATLQPLAPLAIGYAGRIVGIDRAAHLLPEAFYFASLLLLYVLANRLGDAFRARDLVRIRGTTLLDLGTVAVAIFGANAAFSAYTSKSYSEGQAFFLLFACLLCLPCPSSRRILVRAALAGALAGLTYLTRSQFVLVPFALAAALAVVRLRDTRLAGAWQVSLAASCAVVLPWIVFLARSLPTFPPQVLVRFFAYRENDALPELQATVPLEGPVERLLDLFASFGQAFHPTAQHGYAESFGPIVYAVPIALALALWQRVPRHRSGTDSLVPAFESLLATATAFVAIVALAPLHLSHMAVGWEWLFGWRHGLPLVLAIVLAIAFLWRLGPAARVVLLAAVIAGTLFRGSTPDRYILAADRPPSGAELALVAWIDEHPRRPVVLTTYGRSLAASSQAVTHVPSCEQPGNLQAHLSAIELDYILIQPGDLRVCPGLRGLDPKAFERVGSFGSGPRRIVVYRPAAEQR
jgi:hypothetical protein